MPKPGFILLATSVWITQTEPVLAQTALFDTRQLERACASGICLEATSSVISALTAQGLAGDALNSQIGVVAAALLAAARYADAAASNQILQGLIMLSELTTDGAQRSSLLFLARQIQSGDLGLFDLESPFAASPA